ncbi:MAG: methyltransferase [Deltaproteobacteria bacterium]|nr:methyltransferase [Deltaproteobacteria bacterium]
MVARRARDSWLAVRDRVLASPRFQRWAAKFPLTRGVADRRTNALFDVCAGFVYSQVLSAVVEVGLLDLLAERPRTAAELAPRLALSEESAQRLCDAAVSLRLGERRGQGRYGLGIHGASLVGNPAVASMVRHHRLLYRDLGDPVALLRGSGVDRETELRKFWGYVGDARPAAADDVAGYSSLMACSQPLIADDIVEAYPLARHRRLLDVGGGEGAFLEVVAAAAPSLALTLFDLPPVAQRARSRLDRAGLLGRTTVVGGDLFEGELPPGADVATLVRIIHDHDDAHALRILRSVRRALAPGGVLLVAELMSGTRGAEPMGDAYFGFYLLAMGQGRPRTADQLTALLREAGFVGIRRRKTRRPMLTNLLVARVAS